MLDDQKSEHIENPPSLPFDPRTVLRAIWGRMPWLILIVLLGAGMGLAAALEFGTRTFESEAILHYQPEVGCPADTCSTIQPTLSTLVDSVKVQSNLAGIRKELDLNMTLQDLGAAFTVTAKKNGDLLFLRAQSDSPERARQLCEAMLETFLAARAQQLRGDKTLELRSQESALRLNLSAIEGQLEKVAMEAKQLRNDSTEQRKMLGLDDADRARIQRQLLGEKIAEDRRLREANVVFKQAEAEYHRAQQLAKQGLIPQVDLEKARTEFERAQVALHNSPDGERWKAERERLEAIATSGGYGLTPAEQLLLLVLNRGVDLELRLVDTLERIRSIAAKLVTISSPVAPDTGLGVTATGFSIISDPERQPRPASSTRRLLAVVVAVLFIGIGFSVIIGREILDRTLRSPEDAQLHLGRAPIVAFPRMKRDVGLEPGETYRFLAQRILRECRSTGSSRILIGSAVGKEGKSTVSNGLTRALTALGARVEVETPEAKHHPPKENDSEANTSPGDVAPHDVIVLIEAPPILAYADVDQLSSSIDCALLITKASTTRLTLVQAAVNRLDDAGIRIFGTILNATERRFLDASDVAKGGTWKS